jgi:RNA-binding protein 39
MSYEDPEDLEALIEAPFNQKQSEKTPSHPKDDSRHTTSKSSTSSSYRPPERDDRRRDDRRYNDRDRYDSRDKNSYRRRSPSPPSDRKRRRSPSPQKRGLQFKYKEPEKKEVDFEYEPFDYTLTPEQRQKRTIFVYHLSINATERDIGHFFSNIGRIRDIKLIRDRFTNKSKGFGYVEFADPSSVQSSLSLIGQMLDGHSMMIKASEAEKNVVGVPTTQSTYTVQPRKLVLLYVRGIPPCLEDDDLKEVFQSMGQVVFVSIERKPNEISHEGWVKFKNPDDAKKALITLNKCDLGGGFCLNVGVWNPKKESEDDQEMTIQKRALLLAKLESERNNVSQASPCLCLSGLFDPTREENPQFEEEIKQDVLGEVETFGKVLHIHVDKFSQGNVYLMMDSVDASTKVHQMLHGRYFNGGMITSHFMPMNVYKERFSNVK